MDVNGFELIWIKDNVFFYYGFNFKVLWWGGFNWFFIIRWVMVKEIYIWVCKYEISF